MRAAWQFVYSYYLRIPVLGLVQILEVGTNISTLENFLCNSMYILILQMAVLQERG